MEQRSLDASLDTSPDQQEGPERKRRRKVLSCSDCRRRKVQCDRALPACSRCTKAGKAAACTYEDDPEPSSAAQNGQPGGSSTTLRQISGQATMSISKDIWDDLLSRLLQQERTIERLQSDRGEIASSSFASRPSPCAKADNTSVTDTVLFRGRSFKTQYHGPTDARSSLAHIPAAFVYLREAIARSPSLLQTRRDMEILRDVKKAIEKSDPPVEVHDIYSCLPSRDRTDDLTRLFFDEVDSTFGIIHEPSFLREYETMWLDPRKARPAIVVLVLLMTASVQCLIRNNPHLFVADSPTTRETAFQVVQSCEEWLKRQSHKHTTLTYFQIHCLLQLARQGNSIKPKRTWTESGNLLRIAIASGLHKDTALSSKKTTSFDQEMRRRIWAFVVELDLQSSFDRGMPHGAVSIRSDCGSPSNLRDEDFSEDTPSLPPSRPDKEITKASYLRLSAQSRALRMHLTDLLNQADFHLSYEEVLSYTQRIENHLADLPRLETADSVSVAVQQQIALLHIQLEQILASLHAFATRQTQSETMTSFSRGAFVAAATSIVNKLSDLSRKGAWYLVVLRQDVMRLFVSVGHVGMSCARGAPVQQVTDLLRPFVNVAGLILALCEKRIQRTGGTQFLFVFVIYDLLLRQTTSYGKDDEDHPGVDRICSICKLIAQSQEPNFALKVASHAQMQSGSLGQLLGVTPDASARSSDSNVQGRSTVPLAPAASNELPTDMAFDNTQFLTDVASLPSLNIDDWMLYADAFFPQNLALPEGPYENAYP